MRGRDALRSAAPLAARQHGLLTREQLLAAGLTRRQIDALVADGHLLRVHVGVYAVGVIRAEPVVRRMAAVLATRGVLSHVSAAEHWGILMPRGGPVHVTRATRGERRAGIAVHESALDADEVTVRFGVPVTSLVRTLIDVAGVLRAHELARAFDQAQVLHHLRPLVLAEAMLARPGRRGARPLQALVDDAVDPGQIDSLFELLFLRFCRHWGFGRPETQVEFGIWTADFLFRDAGVVIETDSRRWHATAARRARDARKTAYLQSLGLVVVRVTWQELRDDPAGLAERIRGAATRASSPYSGDNPRLDVWAGGRKSAQQCPTGSKPSRA
jgi:very-short-patch-repair endonuclease